jgi:hypothetical protein
MTIFGRLEPDVNWLSFLVGATTLRAAGRAGRVPKLSREQLALVQVELAEGPKPTATPTICGP